MKAVKIGKNMKAMKGMSERRLYFKIADLARMIDRTSRTVKEWEKKGLIPRPRRDSRGWRVYSEKQMKDIIRLVKAKKYFLK